MTLNLAETSVAKSRPSVPYEANFIVVVLVIAAVIMPSITVKSIV